MTPSQIARRMWTLAEAVHDVTYFSAEARAAFEAAGLRGFWRGYFAEALRPIALACWAEMPALNPIGVPSPDGSQR